MKYQEFEHAFLCDVLPVKSKEIRIGQSLMTYLWSVSQVLYNNITATENDCFYVDANIPKTLKYLEDNWMLQFPTLYESVINWCEEMLDKHDIHDIHHFMVEKCKDRDVILVGVFNNNMIDFLPYCKDENDFIYGYQNIYGESVDVLFGYEDYKDSFTPNALILTNKRYIK